MGHSRRDTILVVGPSAAGKTTVLNVLRERVVTLGIPHVFRPHTDAHTILSRMRQDDAGGGYNHYHPWCFRSKEGHSHASGDPEIPFTFSGNEVAHAMMGDFFQALAKLPFTGHLRYAEWSAGVNINTPDEPASGVDLSFATISGMLRAEYLNNKGLKRVLAVIHPETEDDLRPLLNERRGVPADYEIELGMASWQLDDTAMRIFGQDDFAAALPLFQESGIPYIYSVPNDGSEHLREIVGQISHELLALRRSKEGRLRGGGRERDGI